MESLHISSIERQWVEHVVHTLLETHVQRKVQVGRLLQAGVADAVLG